MSRRKGDNPFKAKQQKMISTRCEAIDGYLKAIPKGVTFDDFDSLINYVVELIGCARSTITRQSAYMNLIAAKYSKMNADVEDIDVNFASKDEFKKAIDYYKATIQSLKGDIQRKEAYYQSDDYLLDMKKISVGQTMLTDDTGKKDCNAYQKKYEDTCEVLDHLLNYLTGMGISLDKKDKSILDNGMGVIEVVIPNNKISSAQLIPFIEFLDKKSR